MKKSLLLLLTLAFSSTFIIIDSGAWAQTPAANEGQEEYVLEEIMVTAEKRSENIQSIASSVAVLDGTALMEMGKVTTAQFLETIPNVRYAAGGNMNADGGIAIRGVNYKQTSDGQPPSATATYVDGVFQGLGGNYDVNRVEVLRGPQGTLYGRSATGGVVAFYTNDPKLDEFSGSVSAEIGEGDRKNAQAVANIPLGSGFAARAAAHYMAQDGYFNKKGAQSATREGRIKLLYQPFDELQVMLTFTKQDRRSNSGGISARLYDNDPNKINYNSLSAGVTKGVWNYSWVKALNVNYNLGESDLTLIGSIHAFKDQKNPGRNTFHGANLFNDKTVNYGEKANTAEFRWGSDSEGKLTWLVGTSYYYSRYDKDLSSVQLIAYTDATGTVLDPDPNTRGAPIFKQYMKGHYQNNGFFTEETFKLRDDTRVTAGLRYDKSRVAAFVAFAQNINVNALHNSLNPPNIIYFPYTNALTFSNITYKLRLEYDLTPNNMLYLLTATGFQPGDIRVNNRQVYANGPDQPMTGEEFFPLPYEEEKLTSYEVGSKNQFLDNRLQLNASLFYYDYTGFRNTINIAVGGTAPNFAIVTTPLSMLGAELSGTWLVTSKDKVSLNLGYLNAEITEFPDVPTSTGPVNSRKWMTLERIPGNAPLTANVGYEHTYELANGGFFVPRLELRYTAGQYLTQVTQTQKSAGLGGQNFAWQKSYTIGNINATYTSPNGTFSMTGYMRNLMDQEFKAAVSLTNTGKGNGVTPGDPRVWGVSLNIKF